MATLEILLDKAQEACSTRSDRQVALRLGLTAASVSRWRNGGDIKDEHLAALIALAQADPALAVLVRQEGAKSPAERKLWGPLWDRLSPVTTVIGAVMVCAMLSTPTPASEGMSAHNPGGMSIMFWRRVRSLAARLLAWWSAPRLHGACHA